MLLLVVVKPAGRGGMQALQIGHDPAVGRASSGDATLREHNGGFVDGR
ncbi:hypothetical protein I553_1703 [Mycobacterium xenopi 4042]|uniref:Uncharacterized protein n=1 Tax=Mycobacterium xenopi 4042 TaxID=1299334 RepID=X7ZB17_MYCXE|nr:hypothetical protein I553_1703 [Mycobacterium xenopi 4042]